MTQIGPKWTNASRILAPLELEPCAEAFIILGGGR